MASYTARVRTHDEGIHAWIIMGLVLVCTVMDFDTVSGPMQASGWLHVRLEAQLPAHVDPRKLKVDYAAVDSVVR